MREEKIFEKIEKFSKLWKPGLNKTLKERYPEKYMELKEIEEELDRSLKEGDDEKTEELLSRWEDIIKALVLLFER